MVVLHSHDLVNWRIIGHAVADTTQIGPEMNWDRMNRYGRGVWAGAIAYHAGKFWVYFGAPDEGYFVTTATNPAGPWSPLYALMRGGGWDDVLRSCRSAYRGVGVPDYHAGIGFRIARVSPDLEPIAEEARARLDRVAAALKV